MSKTNQCRKLYLLAGIAPPDIRRDVCAKVEKKNQKTNVTHSLHGQIPAERRLKRKFFLSFVRPLTSLQKSSAAVNGSTGRTWHHTTALSNWMKANGNTSPWTAWICLNRLHTGVSCNKDQCKRWRYNKRVWPGSRNHQAYPTMHITCTSLQFG